MRVWKSYGIGLGKLILFDSVFKRHQCSTDLVVVKDFFPFKDIYLNRSARASGAEKEGIFPCPESGCHNLRKIRRSRSSLRCWRPQSKYAAILHNKTSNKIYIFLHIGLWAGQNMAQHNTPKHLIPYMYLSSF